MATQMIDVGGRTITLRKASRRPPATGDRSRPDVIRRAVAVVLLVSGLCGIAAAVDIAGASETVRDGPSSGLERQLGPAPGLDL